MECINVSVNDSYQNNAVSRTVGCADAAVWARRNLTRIRNTCTRNQCAHRVAL